MTTITSVDLNNKDSLYARIVNENEDNAKIWIQVDENFHLGKGEKLTGDARMRYEHEIFVRTQALRDKIKIAKHNPHHAHETMQIAKEGLKELHKYVATFWEGRQAAEKVGRSVADQFAKINAAATSDLPFVAVRTGMCVGTIGGVVDAAIQLVRRAANPTEDIVKYVGKRVAGFVVTGGVVGGLIGAAFDARKLE